MKKVINVTANDIKKGEAGECSKCPVTLAVHRVFKSASCVETFPSHAGVYFVKEGVLKKSFDADMPCKVATFIGKFDAGDKVKPFTFTADFKQTFPVPASA